MSDSESDNKPIANFETALSELETLVEQMEQGDLTLEQSLAHFERGMRLSQSCEQALGEAKLKVEQLVSGEQGDLLIPFERDE